MATVYKIHPAIGVARVGNSPDEFFIGPELAGDHPDPSGGFKDAACRVKRQAARFRIFAHHDDGTFDEITDAEAEISWTVHVVNKKAAHPGRGNTESDGDLTIDPGPRTLNAPNTIARFDTGSISFSGASTVTVPLGEIRTNDDGQLLVLGGDGTSASPVGSEATSFWGNDDWYDDVADGSVTATITLRSDGTMPSVEPGWVIVAPPKFAPHSDNSITLYDRLEQVMVDAGHLTTPATTSYTQHIYPILKRGFDAQWTRNVPGYAHQWAHPVTDAGTKNTIVSFLRGPDGSGSMPAINDDGEGGNRLTPTQFTHLERWRDNDVAYTEDWAGVPGPDAVVSPDGMDRAALEHCVGGSFFPGIEAGGKDAGDKLILEGSIYTDPFRIDHTTVSPGDITRPMALPWQADFNACTGSWWPVPRPGDVIVPASGGYEAWDRDVGDHDDMVAKWHTLGFVVEQGTQQVEVDRCDTPSIQLLTPTIDFIDIPQGPMGMTREVSLSISFEVISETSAVTLQYAAGGGPAHPQVVALDTSVTVGPTAPSAIATARLRLVYRTDAIGAIPTQTLTVEHAGTSDTWTILVDGNTIGPENTAVALVLDKSGSMSDDAGDGTSKHSTLVAAAKVFVDVMLEGDGVGIVAYDSNATSLLGVDVVGAGGVTDLHREAAITTIDGPGLVPGGNTSIGDGIFVGREILGTAVGTYDHKALVVLTDGMENSPRYIADVADEIDERTFSVGLGTANNTSAPALQTVSGNHGGFLLITGAIGTESRFLLQKYFLQILAGATNAEIILDPDGVARKGVVQKIPFRVTEADGGIDVILLSPQVQVIDFRLQTPTGQVIEPWRAMAEESMRYVLSDGVSYYRLVLPAEVTAERFDHGGTWHAIVTLGRPRLKPTHGHPEGIDRSIFRGMHRAPTRERMRATPNADALRGRHAPAAERAADASHTHVARRSNDQPSSRRGVPFSVVVHAYSSVSLKAQVRQPGYEPGTVATIDAWLSESGVRVEAGTGSVWAEVTDPAGGRHTVSLAEGDAGEFTGSLRTRMAGTYAIRVRASGRTRRGRPFTRERSLTCSVWHGGDRDADPSGPGTVVDIIRDRDERFCELLACLFGPNGVVDRDLEKRLGGAGVNLAHLRHCLARWCRRDRSKERPR